MSTRLRRTPKMFSADVRAIKRMAQEVVRQCGFYERNGHGDELRFVIIDVKVAWLAKRTGRALRRYDQEAD